MPGDGLTFAVQVGREPDVTGSLGQFSQFRDRAGLIGVDLVGGGEVVIHVDPRHRLLRALGRPARQVADVADRGLHHESRPQILLDRLGLGGALDDHELVIAFRDTRFPRTVAGLPGRTAASRASWRGRLLGHGERFAGGCGKGNDRADQGFGIGAFRPCATIFGLLRPRARGLQALPSALFPCQALAVSPSSNSPQAVPWPDPSVSFASTRRRRSPPSPSWRCSLFSSCPHFSR